MQDDPNLALLLATRAGKKAQVDGGYALRPVPFPPKPYNKSFIDKVCSVKMAG